MQLIQRLFITGLALVLGVPAFGQLAYHFRNFTIADGLSQSSVTCIVQDDIGTLWIGTQDGLNRFDGQQFQVFTSDDTPGLESEYIYCGHKDKNGILWFGTTNGLTSYDPQKEIFSTVSLGASPLSIDAIDELSNGDLVLGTTLGLAKLNHVTQKIQIMHSGIPGRNIQYLKLLTDDDLLVSTEDEGCYIYNLKTKHNRRVQPQGLQINWQISDVEPFSGSIYLLSTNKGLWLYDLASGKLSPFLTQIEKDLGIIEIADVFIRTPTEFYVATQNKGLLTVRKEKGNYTISQSKQDIFQKNALLFDEMNTLFSDKSGAIWIGTLRGLSCFDPVNQGFLGIGPSGNLALGLPSPSVWGFAEDAQARFLFIATDVGISKLDRKTGIFQQFYLSQGVANKESSILSMLYVNEHELLIGCTDGLYNINHDGKSYSYKKVDYKKLDHPTNFDKVYSICAYSNGRYFLGTKGGVLLYDRKSGVVTPFVYDPFKRKETIGNGICRLVYKGIDGYYFAPSSGGLYMLKDKKDGSLKIVPFKHNSKLAKVTKDYISTIYQANSDELWVGTTGSGLIRIDIHTGAIKSIKKEQGLPNNFVYGVLPDSQGNLWMSTNKGLACYNIRSERSSNFREVHGLMSNEFNTGAYLASVSGELFFGGISGYNFFNPNKLNAKRAPLEIHFTKFKLEDQWVHPGDPGAPFKTTISDIRTIELPYTQRSFTLRFAASELMNPQLLEYKYRLRGSDEEEIFLGSSNEIRFTSLSPGNYTLEVYARRTDGQWSTSPATLDIEVASPFWWKWWFWVLVALVLALSTYFTIRRRIDQARREQARLQ